MSIAELNFHVKAIHNCGSIKKMLNMTETNMDSIVAVERSGLQNIFEFLAEKVPLEAEMDEKIAFEDEPLSLFDFLMDFPEKSGVADGIVDGNVEGVVADVNISDLLEKPLSGKTPSERY